jgi:Mg2+ and Co2+ transporter CorA
MIDYYHSTARARGMAKVDEPKAGSWCHAVAPTSKELDMLTEQLGLDRDLLEDAVDIYEAPRIDKRPAGNTNHAENQIIPAYPRTS